MVHFKILSQTLGCKSWCSCTGSTEAVSVNTCWRSGYYYFSGENSLLNHFIKSLLALDSCKILLRDCSQEHDYLHSSKPSHHGQWVTETEHLHHLNMLLFFFTKAPGCIILANWEYPYLIEYPNAVQCKTEYRLEIEAETGVWYGSYVGYKRVQMTSTRIRYFWKKDH